MFNTLLPQVHGIRNRMPLGFAAFNGHLEAVKYLVAARADIAAKDSKHTYVGM